MPVLFAYPSTILKHINRAQQELVSARNHLTEKHESLTATHRQLRVIHDLMILLQAAPDLTSVQQRVLGVVTTGLGFRSAVVGLVDSARDELGSWQVYPAYSSFPSIDSLPLDAANGQAFRSVVERKVFRTAKGDAPIVRAPALNA